MRLATRLSLKILWLKKTSYFLWAHKPLCKLYREDVLKIKGIYLCRSCLFVYLGGVLGLILALFLHLFQPGYSHAVLIVLTFTVLPLSSPKFYKGLSRRWRDLIRLTAGILIIFIFSTVVEGHFFLVLIILLISSLFWKMYYRQRAKRKIEFCSTCAEHATAGICSGYQLQAASIREYEQEATDFILRTGYTPQSLKK